MALGLDFDTEIFIDLPTYYSLSVPAASGFGTSFLGAKHAFIQGKTWVVSLQGIVTLPSGSALFGSQGIGGTLNAIATYSINEKFCLAGMFGVSNATEPSAIGGDRFNSINPSLELVYQPSEKMSTFVELFGQTKTDALGGYVFSADCGLIYQIEKNICWDIEFAQSIRNSAFLYNQYLGSGVTILF